MTTALVEPVALVRAETGDFALACQREWLVTNGLGGFASGTVGGALTRRYHGLLVAALAPPVQRTVLVAKLEIGVHYGGHAYALGSNEYADGTVHPQGQRLIESVALDGGVPVWRYALGDALLEQRVWMERGKNTTLVQLSLVRGSMPAALQITPLCGYRDYHSLGHGGWPLGVTAVKHGCRIDAFEGAQPFWIRADGATFEITPDWHWGFRYRVENERGLDDTGDLFRPGRLHASLRQGESLLIELSIEELRPEPAVLQREQARQAALLLKAPPLAPDWIRRLVLAADQFVARRGSGGQTLIAGYPWFSDWGRDTMIALPGLLLATGRHGVAAQVLRTFAAHVSEGMLPNRFPDAGETPEYNTVDATLWYFDAIAACVAAGGQGVLLKQLYPVLVSIIDWHLRGTRYGIGIDPADGLLRAGEPGVQLTWMDAKVGDWVVTPRIGKPVEVNALWINALALMAGFARTLGEAEEADRYAKLASRANDSFVARFWFAAGGYLYDVIDGPEGELDEQGRRADASLRPNQIIAVALPTVRLDAAQLRAVVDVCGRELYTSRGLRSLAPGDARYAGHYGGGPLSRDGAYHQGTVWGWLLGPFARAHYRAYGDATQALSYLDGVADQLREGCIGSVSEIFDADPPHAPRGCFAQAWGVAEPLRAWAEISARAVARPANKRERAS
jgi:predicted glycogen debranching enzyme